MPPAAPASHMRGPTAADSRGCCDRFVLVVGGIRRLLDPTRWFGVVIPRVRGGEAEARVFLDLDRCSPREILRIIKHGSE